MERSPCDRGWFDLGMENLDPDQEEGDLKEGYRIGNDLAPDHPLSARRALPGPQPVAGRRPRVPPGHGDQGAVHRLAGQVTAAVAVALELPEDYFAAW